MIPRAKNLSFAHLVLAVPVAVAACSAPGESTDPDGTPGGTGGASASGGTTTGGKSGATSSGGASGAATTAGRSASGGSSTTGGASASGGAATGGTAGTTTMGGTAGMSGAAGSGVAGSGGASAGTSAGMSTGGASGAAGMGVAGSFVGGGTGGATMVPALDCGMKGTALENHGPPTNRVNYVIVGDGYSEEELAAGGKLDDHLAAYMDKRFNNPVAEPYGRYRNFVNICVLRIPSTPICGSSVFGCCGDDQSRLANCNTTSINNAIRDNLPASFEVDWRATVLNGDRWWNSGGTLMLWSGGNPDAPGGALHEGGHGFHGLSDEYGNCEQSRVSREATYGVNVSLMNNDSGDKWPDWVGYDHDPGTGVQGFFACDGNATWRPSDNSMMNSLFGEDPDTSYNPVSKEKIVMDIWRAVASPYDSVSPDAGPVTNPASLTVNVIDPKVINVDWTVDGNVVAMNGGPTYNIGSAGLPAGMHTVTARAYDNAGPDLVKQVPGTTFNRQYWGSGAMGHSDKTVTWTVTLE